MNCHYLVLQATYHVIEYALYSPTGLVEYNTLEKTEVCRFLVSRLNSLVTKNDLSWSKIGFIGVSQGPAPFTTLRGLITTVNGISFARHIPLIGLDGLKSFLTELPSDKIRVIIQNAFAKDVYFAIQEGDDIECGWDNGTAFLASLKERYPQRNLLFAGNGILLLANEITALFGTQAELFSNDQEIVSLKTVAQLCKEKWDTQKKGTPHLSPLYLKTQEYKTSY